MENYQHNVFRAYLEKVPPEYVPPTLKCDALKVGTLKPNVTFSRIMKFPNEHAVVLEGSNLWFCYEVHLGERDNKIVSIKISEAISSRSIQFTYEPTDKSERLVTSNKMKIALHSHFANPIRRNVPVEQVIHLLDKNCIS